MENVVWIVLASMLAGGVIDRIFAIREWKKFYEGQDMVVETAEKALSMRSVSSSVTTTASRRKTGADERTPR
jgi:hypothetical protein